MRQIIIIMVVALSGCAADIGKNKSEDLQTENTTLKLKIQQLTIERNDAADSARGVQRALDACYKGSGR